MANVIVYSRPDGGISVVYPAYGDRFRLPNDTDDDLVARCLAKLPTDASDVAVIDGAAIPSDRTFRAAWTAAAGTVTVDMPKARAIHLDRIRAEREVALAALDVEFSKAIGAKDQAAADAVEAKRQALRDLPASVASILNAAATPEALKAIDPKQTVDDAIGKRAIGGKP